MLRAIAVAVALATQGTEPAVYLMPDVRDKLYAAWDSVNPRQHERGYCLAARRMLSVSGDSVWVVFEATRAVAVHDGPSHSVADCGSRPYLHTHTPTTCTRQDDLHYAYETCVLGGEGKDVTWPSPNDRSKLQHTGAPFALIQFSPHGYTSYYPP